MKSKYLLKMSVVVGLLLSTVGVGQAFASDSDKLCSVSNGSSYTCVNTMSKTDDYANFTSTMQDYVQAPDAYNIKYIMTTWKSTVLRGDPVYKSYQVVDNYNGRLLYTNNDYYGKYLEDYGTVNIGINQTAGYHPGSYNSPVSTLEIQNLKPTLCNGTGALFCRSYTQASQISVGSSRILADFDTLNVNDTVSGLSAMESSSIDIKLPKNMPFIAEGSYSQTSHLGDFSTVEATFTNNDAYMTIKATDGEVNLTSDNYQIQEGTLENTAVSKYIDNGVVQMLDWKQEGLSYTILISSEIKKFTQAELEDIANSIE